MAGQFSDFYNSLDTNSLQRGRQFVSIVARRFELLSPPQGIETFVQQHGVDAVDWFELLSPPQGIETMFGARKSMKGTEFELLSPPQGTETGEPDQSCHVVTEFELLCGGSFNSYCRV